MIDEGLWLVCYEVKGIRGDITVEMKECDGKDLAEYLRSELNTNDKQLAITNMVRLGDLKTNE